MGSDNEGTPSRRPTQTAQQELRDRIETLSQRFATPPVVETPRTKRNRHRRRSLALCRERKKYPELTEQSRTQSPTVEQETPGARRRRKARERKKASRATIRQKLDFEATFASSLQVAIHDAAASVSTEDTELRVGATSGIGSAKGKDKQRRTAPLTSQEYLEQYGSPPLRFVECDSDYFSDNVDVHGIHASCMAVVGGGNVASPENNIESADSRPSVPLGKRKRVVPSTTQEVRDNYPTPDNETPLSKRRRVRNLNAGLKRLETRKARNFERLRVEARTNEPSFELISPQVGGGASDSDGAHSDADVVCGDAVAFKCAVVELSDFDEGAFSERSMQEGRHYLGGRDVTCSHCLAKKWQNEKPKSCCLDGAIQLAPVNEYPPQLKALFASAHFLQHIRAYNSIFAFSSLGADLDRNVDIDEDLANGKDGVYTYRLHGALCHRIGTLMPPDNHGPNFAQIYFYDSDMGNQVNRRMSIMDGLREAMVTIIQSVLMDVNPYVHQFITAGELTRSLGNGEAKQVSLRLHRTVSASLRTYNRPTASEVAAIIVNNQNAHRSRDLVLRQRQGGFLRVFENWACYDPLQYPILFPRGEHGWHQNIPLADPGARKRLRVSVAQFCAYRLYEKNVWDPIFYSGRLAQQYTVDQYAKVEQQRLLYQRRNQKKLRGNVFSGLQDMIEGDEGLNDFSNVGTRAILTASFTNGPRYMRNEYLNSMAVVREMGKPHLFITMTANAKWKEITEELHPGQKATDRPELVSRVFKMKLDSLMEDLTKRMIFGKVIGHVHVVEFQKRGLPHGHILLIMDEEDRPSGVDQFDKYVTAELPDKRVHPNLFATVSRCMIHGPCGPRFPEAPCMEKGKCQKKYPKPFTEQTTADFDGYPRYKRRNIRTPYNMVFAQNMRMGNEWVVPYNAYLSMKYDCHINVEICSTITAVKYLYKYVYKGVDRAIVTVGGDFRNRDEIKEFLDARYVSSSEACWRLFRYPLHGRSHSVVPLEVHLDGENYCVYDPLMGAERILEGGKKTKLTEYFNLCRRDSFAATLLYQEVPKHYTWKEKRWELRKRGGESVIGRLITCSPTDVQRYHLRMLLCYRRGPTCFDDLRTVSGHCYSTYQEAALALGYIADDGEYDKTLTEAASEKMPAQLRKLFATILVYCQPTNPIELWDKHLEAMAEDFTWNRDGTRLAYNSENIVYSVAKSVDEYLNNCSGASTSLAAFPSLPQLSSFDAHQASHTRRNPVLDYELSYNTNQLRQSVSRASMLNRDQRAAYDAILSSVSGESDTKLFYLDGPGGTGKTFLIQQLLARIRLDGNVALATATSGIAALLLTGGRTVHSRFKVPVENIDEGSVCNMPKQGKDAELMRAASFIVIDEAPMLSRYVVECVDRSLRDIRDKWEPFGGAVVLFAGDFRQTLPVIPKAAEPEIISACLQKWALWRSVKRYHLTINERLRRGGNLTDEEHANIEAHSNFLLTIGEGTHPIHDELGEGYAQLPSRMMIEPTRGDSSGQEAIINHVYGGLDDVCGSNYFASRVILAPKNAEAHAINSRVLDRVSGIGKTYQSIDSVECDDDANLYPLEFLNTIELSGLPKHRLELKVGVPIMLMRNINAQEGLCNGTRLQVLRLSDNCICAVILTGENQGNTVFIPRITLSTKATQFPFILKRRQFPVQVAFAMTINKSQGQSVDTVGIYLPDPVFAHGQLYVALSRSTSADGLRVVALNCEARDDSGSWTRNVVYRQLFIDNPTANLINDEE